MLPAIQVPTQLWLARSVSERVLAVQRAEHNEGMISNLEELALHQQHIEKIELLHRACRNLKILLLQSNLISKIQNLHRLKQLQYLNLALNNVSKVQNLQRCESLEKLDLTMNFIPVSGLLAFHTLRHNEFLRDVYFMGNPCCDWHGYRKYALAVLPALSKLDGEDVKPSERIAARQVCRVGCVHAARIRAAASVRMCCLLMPNDQHSVPVCRPFLRCMSSSWQSCEAKAWTWRQQ